MTSKYRRFGCLALVIALLAALLPAALDSGNQALADDPHLGMTTVDKVNVRVGPARNEKYLFLLPINYVCQVLGQVTKNNVLWYEVYVQSPDRDNDHYYQGYILGECFRLLTDAESAQYKASQIVSTPTPTPAPGQAGYTPTPVPASQSVDRVADAGATGYITNGGVNLREGPGRTRVLMKLNRGDIVTLLTIPSVISDETYYRVSFNGIVGYVMSTFVNPNGTGPVTTRPPTGLITPSPTPQGVLGYVMTTKGGVRLRATIGGSTVMLVGKYETYPYLLEPSISGGYTWYFVKVGEKKGYLRGDCVKVVNSPGTVTAVPAYGTPTPTPVPGAVTPTPVPAVVTPTPVSPATAPPHGYIKTSVNSVNVRKTPAGDRIGMVKEKGTILPYYGTPVTKSGNSWYYINTKEYGYCYIMGTFVTACDEYGNPISVTPTPAAAYTPTPQPGTTAIPPVVTPSMSGQEASYSTLKLGSKGDAVKKLVTELKKQGYYVGDVISSYTTAVEAAVKAFQRAKGLTADGIAGPATQHKLYGTVPVGTSDGTDLAMTLYPAEKIDWNTGGINEMWAKGANYKIYDVKTGIVWWAHRWSGGLHVDAEPLTAADTARLCKIYGVSKSSDITSSKHYQRRPCLVTIGNRTFACSLYGVPHNYPEGDTIPDNDFRGQLCIHFSNSKTHSSRKVDSGHEEAIEYAWLNAPNGHI